MKNIKYIVLIFCALSFFGCKKNQLGGKSNIKGKVLHHEKAIPFAKIYIKFNATEFPGTNVANYDTSIDADHNGNFLIENIYHGDYYFYAVGEDKDVPAPYVVKGGTPLKVKRLKEVTGFVVPVTED
ncbi:MAG: hypothetical protein Q7W45_08450 [Bacteroidota bacterium]|nr:hypothetical protein [Bacteroidota bacterium]MDP3144292.1 hypothetical protein [Bacteroidota bacterium]MDP3556278.1 hypothetical protein [Bacteroidota bacterium]